MKKSNIVLGASILGAAFAIANLPDGNAQALEQDNTATAFTNSAQTTQPTTPTGTQATKPTDNTSGKTTVAPKPATESANKADDTATNKQAATSGAVKTNPAQTGAATTDKTATDKTAADKTATDKTATDKTASDKPAGDTKDAKKDSDNKDANSTKTETKFVRIPEPPKVTDFSKLTSMADKKALYQNLSATELAKKIRSGEISKKEVLDIAYALIEDNKDLNAVVTTRKDAAYAEAEKLTPKYEKKDQWGDREGQPEGTERPFYGVPLLLKGLTSYTLKGEDASDGIGYKIKNGVKATETDAKVKYLRGMGFVIIGQTNAPEDGFKNIGDNRVWGSTGNGLRSDRNAGGSSSGAAAAVATGIVPMAAGSDAGGSIRIPSGWNSLIGLKPSWGNYVRFHNSLTGTGYFPLVRNVEDLENFFDHFTTDKSFLDIQLKKVKEFKNLVDAEMQKNPKADRAEVIKKLSETKPKFNELTTPKKLYEAEQDFTVPSAEVNNKLKIAYTLESPLGTPVDEEAKKAVLKSVEFFKSQGYTVEEVKTPYDGQALLNNALKTIAFFSSTDWGGLKELQSGKASMKDVDPMTWAMFETGLKTPGIQKAQDWTKTDTYKELAKNSEVMYKFYEKYDLWLTPTNAKAVPERDTHLIDEKYLPQIAKIQDLPYEEQLKLLREVYVNMISYTPFTPVDNLTGNPAVSLPVYVNNQLEAFGVLVHAGYNKEKLLINVAKLLDQNHLLTFPQDLRGKTPADTKVPDANAKVTADTKVPDAKAPDTKVTEIKAFADTVANKQVALTDVAATNILQNAINPDTKTGLVTQTLSNLANGQQTVAGDKAQQGQATEDKSHSLVSAQINKLTNNGQKSTGTNASASTSAKTTGTKSGAALANTGASTDFGAGWVGAVMALVGAGALIARRRKA